MANDATHPTPDELKASAKMIEDLQARKLPQMVNWWDASVLSLVGVRTVISGTIGNYADQRPMQAAADEVTDHELQIRHDYREVKQDGVETIKATIDGVNTTMIVPAKSNGKGGWSIITHDEDKTELNRTLNFDKDGALWVDFIADLGDGFEATYAMAYLMAQDSITLDVPSNDGSKTKQSLPAGEIMIMGGDLAYPNATVEEYRARCLAPFNAAFQLKEDQPAPRKLFFIAGNHDWYDGLAAFTSVFCTARDRHADGKGLVVGGWQAEQRRSYFALALPHGWWIWGVDLALNVTIDEAQKNYFETISEKTKPGEKVIIVVHAPVWQSMHDSPLHDVSKWARERGAEVVAMVAGDLHFYSRFHSINPVNPTETEPKLPQQLQLIVSGGGGAFLHPTHQVPRTMKVHWTLPKPAKPMPREHKSDFKDVVATITTDDEAVEQHIGPLKFHNPHPFDFQSPHIYPSKGRSMMLSLKNLLLPFHNRKFALFMGVFYLVYAWVFQITTQDPDLALERARADNIKIECNLTKDTAIERARCYEERIQQLKADRSAARLDVIEKRLGMEPRRLPTTIPTRETPPAATNPLTGSEPLPYFGKAIIDFVSKYPAVFGETGAETTRRDLVKFEHDGGWTGAALRVWERIYPRIDTKHVINAMLSNPAFFFMIIGLYAGLIYYVGFEDGEFVSPAWLKWPVKFIVGGFHAWLHIVVLLGINGMLQGIYIYFTDVNITWPWLIFGVTLYSVLLILIGGIAGGMLFGTYWVLASIIGKMHMDSFGALGIAGYKNFLRLKVEPDKITVYAIGLDKVPGRKGWRALHPKDDTRGHNPIIKPINDLKPHLIEPPYEIRTTAKTPPPASTALKARPVSPPGQATKRPEPAEAVARSNLPDGLPAWKNIWSPS